MHTIKMLNMGRKDCLEQTNIERRRHKRVAFREPVQYHLPIQSNHGGCLAADISEGGIRINFNDFVPLDSEMIFQVFLSATKAVRCVGRVMWVQKLPFSDRYQAGLKFSDDDATTDSNGKLRQFIGSR